MDNDNSNITLIDIFQIKKIIEVVCTRGAIQAHEMETVGRIHKKLSKILDEQSKGEGNNELPVPGNVNG